MNNSEILNELSVYFQEQCRRKWWTQASATLCRMAKTLHADKEYEDELRCLILSFYIDMSGWQQQAFVNEYAVGAMRETCELLEVDKEHLKKMYYEAISVFSSSHHSFTPTGCLRVLTYCVFGKNRKADKIMSYLQK